MRLPRALARRGALALRAHQATLRVRAALDDGTLATPAAYPFGREVFALREGDALALAGLLARARFTVLVAKGRDGDWATALLTALGCRVVRGATARGGGRALLALVDALRDSPGPAGIVVDGPLGPAGEAKGGAVLLGRKTGRPVRALGIAASPTFVFPRTWSGLHLPLPFARLAIAVEAPLAEAPAGLPPAEARRALDEATAELTRRLASARRRAEAMLAGAA